MNIYIDIQHATKNQIPVSDDNIREWVTRTLKSLKQSGELTVRLVEDTEMIDLNNTYRKQPKTTNVLSFKADIPAEIELEYPLLGDIIICPEVLKEESDSGNIPLIAHWAHIVIHGVLHLLGYDHIYSDDAKIMQELEIKLLAEFGFSNPYLTLKENYLE